MNRFHRVTVQVEFTSEADAAMWLKQVTDVSNLPPTAELVFKKMKMQFSECRICGIDRKFNTLGNSTIGYPADECRPAHASACQRRMERNASPSS